MAVLRAARPSIVLPPAAARAERATARAAPVPPAALRAAQISLRPAAAARARACGVVQTRTGCVRALRCVASAAAASVPAVAPAPAVGAKLVPAVLSVGVGLLVRFVVPCPAGVTMQAWSLLAIFLSTITGLVLEPLPVGAWAFLGLTAAARLSRAARGACSDTRGWTAADCDQGAHVPGCFHSVHVGRDLADCHLLLLRQRLCQDGSWRPSCELVRRSYGARPCLRMGERRRNAARAHLTRDTLRHQGSSTLGLSYGLVLAEALISPAMPSTTARAGGVFLPIITSLAKQAGSLPGATARRLGAFLVQAQLQCAAHSSALFLTAAAQNLLALKLAAEVTGVPLADPWLTWFRAACVPAVAALALTPALVYTLYPPEVRETPEAPAAARARLAAMGPFSRDESLMCAVMALAVGLWVFGDALGVSSVLAAMVALCCLLLTGVLAWADCLAEKSAWDTLLWFAVLVGMSGQLNALGLVRVASDAVASQMAAAHLGWQAVALLTNGAYFAMHYVFASQTAHVGALLAACLAVMLAAGVPPVLATLTLAFTTNLFGAITHYSSGQAAVYYGAGYTDLRDTFKLGGICALANLSVWGVVGSVWWKVIGLY